MGSEQLLAPSTSFKKEAAKSISAILFFMLVYLLLMAFSIALLVCSFYAGIGLFLMKPGLYTILGGLGIVAVGVMVFVFLVKFLFSSNREDNSNSIEITVEEQPRLFAVIYEIARQTGTKRPKKVFLSPDVNACVFYNSSFWSMFLPVRKNIKIGLGLVNAVNSSELKAVIAHEFGHFSQRSMKLGSWVYQVNKIIHDMLYNNKGYGESLSSMSSAHGILSIFAHITVGIVRSIQWILRQVFGVVNRSYMALSRQMEFHADLVASSLYGSNNVVNALYRIEFADACFNDTIQLCNTALKQKKMFVDFYANHGKVQQQAAQLRGLPVESGLVQPRRNETIANRVNFKDQWASHPTIKEREEYLIPFQLESPADPASAWKLFTDEATWKHRLTEHLYAEVPIDEKQLKLDEQGFEKLLMDEVKRASFPKFFGEYYDGREIKIFDAEAVAASGYSSQPIGLWFDEEQKSLPKRIALLEQDIQVLDAIAKKAIATNSFDFDGVKYRRGQAEEVKTTLEAEKEVMQKDLEALDQKLFRHACALVPQAKAEELKQEYLSYFSLRKEAEEYLTIANNMMEVLAPVFRGETMQIEAITSMIEDLKSDHEPGFKAALKKWNHRGVFEAETELKNKIEIYLAADWVYFHKDSFMDAELIDLNTIVQESWACISDLTLSEFRIITEKQAECFVEMNALV